MTDTQAAQIRPGRRAMARILRGILVGTVRRATSDRRALPAFVVIGAQRAGTTTLWRWLLAHPQVLPPVLDSKGVHWFDLDAHRPPWWYRAHFPLRSTLARRTPSAVSGEASPYYLFHPRAPEMAAATLPDTRFVVLLRDPVSRAVSHYHHMRDEGNEPLDTLEAALAAEPGRLEGAEAALLADPSAVHQHHLHHAYAARGRYAQQLERWFAAVGRDRVLVLDAGRMRSEPDALMAEICSFIGIDPALAASPSPGVNAGHYAPPDPAVVTTLRASYAEDDERLWALLGERWW